MHRGIKGYERYTQNVLLRSGTVLQYLFTSFLSLNKTFFFYLEMSSRQGALMLNTGQKLNAVGL